MVQPKLTLFTPTFNRPQYVIRLLDYYSVVDFQGRIYIGDSSDDDVSRKIQGAVNNVRDHLDIVYERYPGQNGVECVRNILDSITTKYAAFAADDDFFIPNVLNECVDFLEANPDYSAAHGMAVWLNVESNGLYGRITNLGGYKQPAIEANKASDRLKSLLGDYSVTLFSVHSTETWKRMYHGASEIVEWRRFGGELLQCSRTVLYGKIKQLDSLSLIRQVYDANESVLTGSDELGLPLNMSATYGMDEFDWVTSDDWLKSYQAYLRKVSSELGEIEDITDEDADLLVKGCFWSYLNQALFQIPSGTSSIIGTIKANLRYLPGLYRLLQWLQANLFGNKGRLSLKGLLKKSSPHNSNFMPVYRSLIGATRLDKYDN